MPRCFIGSSSDTYPSTVPRRGCGPSWLLQVSLLSAAEGQAAPCPEHRAYGNTGGGRSADKGPHSRVASNHSGLPWFLPGGASRLGAGLRLLQEGCREPNAPMSSLAPPGPG